jgi:hypothetical protein
MAVFLFLNFVFEIASQTRIKLRTGVRDLAADVLSVAFRAESAHEIDDQAYQQNQANPAAANGGTSEVKSAAAE